MYNCQTTVGFIRGILTVLSPVAFHLYSKTQSAVVAFESLAGFARQWPIHYLGDNNNKKVLINGVMAVVLVRAITTVDNAVAEPTEVMLYVMQLWR